MPVLRVDAAVEGDIDEAVVQRLLSGCGAELGTVYGREGKHSVRRGLRGFNKAAEYGPWIVLLDLDNDAICAPRYRAAQLPQPGRFMCFRIPVRAIEAWLLADVNNISTFLSVGRSAIPRDPDTLVSPKQTLVQLARTSRSRSIRADLVPSARSGRQVGNLYNSRLSEFVLNMWDPTGASIVSPSLSRAVRRLSETLARYLEGLGSE
jgi:hypothetical protein